MICCRPLLSLFLIPLLGCAAPTRGGILAGEPVAEPRSISVERRVIRDDATRVFIEYPVFRLAYPEAEREINADIESEIQIILRHYLSDRSIALESWGDDPGGWELTVGYEVETLERSLLSYWFFDYRGTGGAYSNGEPSGRTYRLGPNGLEPVKLASLFLPDVDYRRALAALCLSDLKEQGASYVVEGEVDEEDLIPMVDNFTLDNELLTLEIVFPTHVAGTHGEGEFWVSLDYQELSDLLDPEGLLGAYATSMMARKSGPPAVPGAARTLPLQDGALASW